MKSKISKTKSKKQIEEFFLDIKNKTPKEIKKIKRLAMKHNIPLKEKRKLFCKKCYVPYNNPKTRIKNKKRVIECKNCGNVSGWKMK